jgi:hypothetical protein
MSGDAVKKFEWQEGMGHFLAPRYRFYKFYEYRGTNSDGAVLIGMASPLFASIFQIRRLAVIFLICYIFTVAIEAVILMLIKPRMEPLNSLVEQDVLKATGSGSLHAFFTAEYDIVLIMTGTIDY